MQSASDLNYNFSVADTASKESLLKELHQNNKSAEIYDLFYKGDLNEKKLVITSIFNYDKLGSFTEVVTEGLRTNVSELFSHIIFSSDYCSNFLSQREFNQLVLKGMFLDLDIMQIPNLKAMKNTLLDQMVIDYKEERELANRDVPASVLAYLSLGE